MTLMVYHADTGTYMALADCDLIEVPDTVVDADEIEEFLEKAEPTRIAIVANITGGVLQGASCNYPGVELYTLDFEHDGADDSELIEIDGDTAICSSDNPAHDPEFVQRVIDAPTLDEEEDEDAHQPE